MFVNDQFYGCSFQGQKIEVLANFAIVRWLYLAGVRVITGEWRGLQSFKFSKTDFLI